MHKNVLTCVCSSVLGAVVTLWLVGPDWSSPAIARDTSSSRPAPGYTLTPVEAINVSVYERVNRAVANITTKTVRGDGFFLFDSGPAEGNGSGFVFDKQGHIVTNFHVIDGAREVTVTLYDGQIYSASFVGGDRANDVAVIKIDAPANVIWPVALGDSSILKVGMRVCAIGNPFGWERTLTTGVISSLNRSLPVERGRTIKSIIQTDAAINPGNSGGPLLNTRGELVGMNMAIYSKSGQSSGVSFAIPVNLISRVVPQLIAHGRIIRPDIGITRVYQGEDGLMIAALKPNGPAQQAGLKGPRILRQRRGRVVFERLDRSTADVITAVDGRPVKLFESFRDYIESKKPGERVVLTVRRGGRKLQVPVTLGDGETPGPDRETR